MAAPTARMLDLTQIGPGDRVLAIGVGTGDEALEAAARVGPTGEIVATDASAAMIAEARRVVAEARLANIRCLVMDAQRLEFAQDTFDVIIARNALMFIPDLPTALAEMKRVLRAAGRIGATVWSSARRNPRISGPLEAVRALGVPPPPTAAFRIALHLGSPSRLAAALRKAGFSDVVVERLAVVAPFETLNAAVEQAMDHAATRELVRLLPRGSEKRMRRSLAKLWERYRDSDGVHMPGEQLVAAGMK
jgi:SAM-dependent methyltransferase